MVTTADAALGGRDAPYACAIQLQLLGDFRFMIMNRPVRTGRNAQRVLAFLALHERAVKRDHLARTLWPDIDASRLLPHLRAVLWRLPPEGKSAIVASADELRLEDHVLVDLRRARRVGYQLIDRSTVFPTEKLGHAMRVNLGDDLLPTWTSEEWIAAERERFRQLRLHSLEILSELLTARGWYGAAADAALCSACADPFRESAWRTLIAVHLAEGNLCQAISEFDRYRQLLSVELDCEPSRQLYELVRSAVTKAHASRLFTDPATLVPVGASQGRMPCGKVN